MHPLTAGRVGKALVALVLGVAVGTVGTLMHRSVQPWGVVACLALVATAGVVARAWDGWPTLVAYALGVLGSTQLLAREGPGGDVLMPAGQAIGWVWVLGAVVVVLGVAAAPRRLFVDPPVERPSAVTSASTTPWPEPVAQPGAVGAGDPVLEAGDDTAP
ncbi:hypothetical protein Cch01nite_03030 [Cellulomonas chitinilytica]|uniref:Uncharacterized protein n=1 Tax=Cellulomonas chitinilytica TaxID=398759 RepID=A0A919P161_9CELL|nr:hypothetical protein [Cellulomonas chitinilytica]GIG19579.1 hypothetical protein Cch01nite_03030 [Cellulomonas chitinilytica]